MATVSSPAAAAAAISSAGVSAPSDAVEWVCRSIGMRSSVDDVPLVPTHGPCERSEPNETQLPDRLLPLREALRLDHREPLGLRLLVPEHQLGDGVVDLFRLGQVLDVVERLDLPGGLDDHR